MADRCRRIADSGVFQGFILVVIVLNAITLLAGASAPPIAERRQAGHYVR
jgi:hypothetical protein